MINRILHQLWVTEGPARLWTCCCCCCIASVVSDSVRPHRWKPTRLRRPWDSPGKNTGVGCHFLLQCLKVKREREVAQSCLTLCNPMDCSLPGSSVHGIFQTRVLEWGAIAFSKALDLPCSYSPVSIQMAPLRPPWSFCLLILPGFSSSFPWLFSFHSIDQTMLTTYSYRCCLSVLLERQLHEGKVFVLFTMVFSESRPAPGTVMKRKRREGGRRDRRKEGRKEEKKAGKFPASLEWQVTQPDKHQPVEMMVIWMMKEKEVLLC